MNHRTSQSASAVSGHQKAENASAVCDQCDTPTANPENEYGEFICDNCLQNAAEAAYERYCEDFHDGGSAQFVTLRDRQIEAMKLK